MIEVIRNTLVERPPITEGWQLLLMLAVGVLAVAVVHRRVKLKIARARRGHVQK